MPPALRVGKGKKGNKVRIGVNYIPRSKIPSLRHGLEYKNRRIIIIISTQSNRDCGDYFKDRRFHQHFVPRNLRYSNIKTPILEYVGDHRTSSVCMLCRQDLGGTAK
ncbi:hypothetical protein PoB_000341500 [Plakobranchus ocellatus]|uniref:Uncharacterized protein n=1 Tax=Plakobranchus ocellatus TaxID=259542 RepID=A0AAV3Y1G1_9GAST|nr:hypothetical protein PoB_000341500 [Plakobranchus ocellatus]